MTQPLARLRSYQKSSFRHHAGMLALMQRRQSGKSHGLGLIGLDWMMEEAGVLVVFMSAALRLGAENIAKEAAVWKNLLGDLRKAIDTGAITSNALDDKKQVLDPDALCDLLEHSKLEVKLWHSRSVFSRSIVIAPNPDTAVGWSGHLILDEVGRMPEFQDVWEAVEPIVSSQQKFRIRLSTTPPPDESHYSYQLLAPNPEEVFVPNPNGNFYVSQGGILCLRVDAHDCHLAGVPLYDNKTRKAITPEEHRDRALDKTAWDRNYGVKFVGGTSAAVSLLALRTAMQRGQELGCVGVNDTEMRDSIRVTNERLFPAAWAVAAAKHGGDIALGLDPATTTGATSNPSGLAALQANGMNDFITRLLVRFKSGKEEWTRALVVQAIDDLLELGIRPKRLVIDATNEKFFAQALANELMAKVPTIMVSGSENLTWKGETMKSKLLLGNLWAGCIENNKSALPKGDWVETDYLLVKRDRGTFVADLGKDGGHGDTFDAGKLALWGHLAPEDYATLEPIGVGSWGREHLLLSADEEETAWQRFCGIIRRR